MHILLLLLAACSPEPASIPTTDQTSTPSAEVPPMLERVYTKNYRPTFVDGAPFDEWVPDQDRDWLGCDGGDGCKAYYQLQHKKRLTRYTRPDRQSEWMIIEGPRHTDTHGVSGAVCLDGTPGAGGPWAVRDRLRDDPATGSAWCETVQVGYPIYRAGWTMYPDDGSEPQDTFKAQGSLSIPFNDRPIGFAFSHLPGYDTFLVTEHYVMRRGGSGYEIAHAVTDSDIGGMEGTMVWPVRRSERQVFPVVDVKRGPDGYTVFRGLLYRKLDDSWHVVPWPHDQPMHLLYIEVTEVAGGAIVELMSDLHSDEWSSMRSRMSFTFTGFAEPAVETEFPW